jgi:hypothetical protein
MDNLTVHDLSIEELRTEIEFIEKYSQLKKGEFALTEDGIVDAEDIRLSSVYKKKITELYNKKIKDKRKKSFTLITN